MNMQEVKKIATDKGIKAGKMKKSDIIRTIQAAEGNSPCFQTPTVQSCDQTGCCWRTDCLSLR